MRTSSEAGIRGASVAGGGVPANAVLIADGLLAYLERSPAGIAIVESGSLGVRYFNPAFERMAEWPADPGASTELTHALPPAAADAVLALIRGMPPGSLEPQEAEISS